MLTAKELRIGKGVPIIIGDIKTYNYKAKVRSDETGFFIDLRVSLPEFASKKKER